MSEQPGAVDWRAPDGQAALARAADGRAVAYATLSIAGLGVLLGLLWWKLSPVAQLRVESDGAYYVNPVPEEFVTSDLRFAFFSVLLGVVAGVVIHRILRPRATAAVVGLAVGGTVASLLAWQLGQWLGNTDLKPLASAPVGTVGSAPLVLTARGLIMVFPVVALAAWLLVDLWGDFRRRNDVVPLPGYEYAPNWVVPTGPPAPPSA